MSDHISALKPDPRTARKHSPRNIGMVADALNEVGAARSIVIDENNVVLAGNGVLEAAGQAGIERLRIIEADGDELIAVQRKNLTAEQKQKLALYDNRAGELAMWDEEIIQEMSQSMDLSEFFYPEELTALLGNAPEEDETNPQLGDLAYRIIVDCGSEEEQATLLERFEADGLTCRALMS
jgi:hypothetical protein